MLKELICLHSVGGGPSCDLHSVGLRQTIKDVYNTVQGLLLVSYCAIYYWAPIIGMGGAPVGTWGTMYPHFFEIVPHMWYKGIFTIHTRILHTICSLYAHLSFDTAVECFVCDKAVSDGGVSNIRSLIHLVILQSLYRHTHWHTDTQSL